MLSAHRACEARSAAYTRGRVGEEKKLWLMEMHCCQQGGWTCSRRLIGRDR